MKRAILIVFFSLATASICLAQTDQSESLTFTTYYPSPSGVYRYLKLSPVDSPPASSRPGMIYYNDTSDSVLYRNKTAWVNLSGGGGGGGGGNGTYWVRTGSGTSADPYLIHNNNTGFVGIGTQTPEAPLTVFLEDNNVNNAYLVGLRKHYDGSAFPDQYLFFKAYPSGTGGYLDATSVMYVPEDPPNNLEFLAVNNTQHIRFNIGNFTDSYSEIMRLRSPDVSERHPKVGIGTADPEFTLQVDSNNENIGVLGVSATTFGRKTGICNISPLPDAVALSYGAYFQNGGWVNDPYQYPAGQYNHDYARFVLSASGAKWSAGNLIIGNNQIPEAQATGWNFAFNEELWNKTGTWVNPIIPTSSRKLKEKFQAIPADELLRKIDQLEVRQWRYKTGDRSTHIGPVAEDFYGLFKTGSSEDQLHIIDSIGVSLAGVKALSKKINAQQKEIEDLENEIRDLRTLLGR